jgi:hypothetical protein
MNAITDKRAYNNSIAEDCRVKAMDDDIFDLQMQLFPLSTKNTKSHALEMASFYAEAYFEKVGSCNESMMMLVSEAMRQAGVFYKAKSLLKEYIK